MAKELYRYDYLTADEMDQVISGKGLEEKVPEKVRDWDTEKNGKYIIQF